MRWCLGLLGLCGVLAAQAQGTLFHRYTRQDGLPSDLVYYAMQDHDGYMWFCTDAGISRFDGYSFITYGPAQGVMDNEVVRCLEDSRGRIWLMLLNGKLSYVLNGVVHNERTDPGLRLDSPAAGWQFALEDTDGSLWFGAVDPHLLHMRADGVVDTLLAFPNGTHGAFSLAHDRSGRIMMYSSGSLFRWEHGALQQVGFAAHTAIGGGLFEPEVQGRDPLLFTSEGILAVTPGGMKNVFTGPFDTIADRRCWQDRAGDLWVWRNDHGIDHWAMRGDKWVDHKLLFPDEFVHHVLLDREGNRWCCSRHGVLVSAPVQLQAMLVPEHPAPDLGGGGILTLCQDATGQVWAGSGNSGLYVLRNDTLVQQPVPDDKMMGRVNRIREAPDGRLLVATDHQLMELLPPPERRMQWIGMFQRRNGALGARDAIGTPNGETYAAYLGLFRTVLVNGERTRVFMGEGPVGRGRTYVLFADRSGRIWFETTNVLNVMDHGTFRSFPALSEHLGIRITDITAYRGDTLVLATTGRAVVLVKDARLLAAAEVDGAEITDVRRVRVVNDTIWTAGKQGVGAFVLRGGHLVNVFRAGRSEGLPTDDANDLLVQPGRLLVATDEGLCALPKRPIRGPNMAPLLRFAAVVLNDSAVKGAHQVSWREGYGRLSLTLRAITFIDQTRVVYQYRLFPDAPWSAMPQGRLDLASLAAGEYAFEARARKGDGPWCMPVGLGIQVLPMWYHRPWVLVGLWTLITAGLLWAGGWVLRRQQRRQLARLAELNMLNEERRRIAADVHDDLGADLSHLMVRAQSALDEGNVDAGRAAITELSKGLKGSLEKIDEIIWSLDPGRDNVRATADFMEHWVREYAHAHGLRFRSALADLSPHLAIHAVQRRELALVVKEAMRNVVKHAQATTVQLRIGVVQGLLRVELEDDGERSPIGAARTVARSGASNMQRRVQRMGGTLRFQPVAPRGTCLIVEVGLETPSPELMTTDGPASPSLHDQ